MMPNIRTLLTTLLASATLISCGSSKTTTTPESKKPAGSSSTSDSTPSDDFKSFGAVISGDHSSDDGLFPVHISEGKVYWEIPDSLFGRDMMLIVRTAGVPEGYFGYAGSGSKAQQRMVRFERKRERIFLRSAASTVMTGDSLPISMAVRRNNLEPIIASFEIAGKGKSTDGWLIEVGGWLLSDDPTITPLPEFLRKQYEVRRLEADRSYVDTVRSYPINVEARSILTYSAKSAPSSGSGALTFETSLSIILLPEEPMRVRYWDPRVGWFRVGVTDFASDEQRVADRYWIRRWRLEPSDPEAYARGELVEPVKPIVFYIDPATPEKWWRWFAKGIEDWNVAFEEAGFKNAIRAGQVPTPEEDPDFSLEDARYSFIRWVANETRNATGPSVSDPRSGEIISSSVIFYQNHMKSYRNLAIIETGAVDPNFRSLTIPDSVIGEALRVIAAHEVGHTLGLPHNMGASYAFPVDSLRSPTFTRTFGISNSIMDYARMNYVAQPGDEGVQLWRKIGPYDLYSINWGYRDLSDAGSAEDERAVLDRWIREKGDDPLYRFGYQQGFPAVDPRSQTEDLGDDAVKASTYGINNLKIVIPSLVDWTRGPHNDYDDLEELYTESLYHWRELVTHVATWVGGVYETPRRPSQPGPIYEPVPRAPQLRALDFLEREALTTQTWLAPTSITEKIDESGSLDRLRRFQGSVLSNLLNVDRMIRLVEAEEVLGDDALPLVEFLDRVRTIVWKELSQGSEIDVYRRNLQRVYVDRIGSILEITEAERQRGDLDVNRTDVRAALRDQLERLQREVAAGSRRSSDRMTRIHLDDIDNRISEILDPGDS